MPLILFFANQEKARRLGGWKLDSEPFCDLNWLSILKQFFKPQLIAFTAFIFKFGMSPFCMFNHIKIVSENLVTNDARPRFSRNEQFFSRIFHFDMILKMSSIFEVIHYFRFFTREKNRVTLFASQFRHFFALSCLAFFWYRQSLWEDQK